ncbi:cytochrome c oxidase accessory protein CcoG [Halovulum dunhuangense]|uniref:Cytochrome c oxidase accessory protein CcoG n=1 Tax=Halovulum dunhuangense TaxID=1505036 RepID=A0A849KYU8_9RHOB|nr:cytochrome c oxidase accessory protein CcoG [Halovulum dunhuangense]NNU78962.1 cytochrome c oxidase accessory protein CcoG [Halovulum dunhuangense]
MSAPASPPKLYEAQEPVFPRRVAGYYRTLKWWIMAITLGIYYITPWIRWDRGPNLPDQAVLVDMAGRRFFFFWIEIWPHEFYFVAGLLIMAGLGLFLFTSALGRVWCGYSCPQTVWTDLFILVERWIEGDRNARVKLWNAPWSPRKARLRLTKWTVWLLIAVATGGAWVFYFADAPTLLRQLFTLDAPVVAYASVALLTATTFVFGGFLREQVCIYMCPWPRIQAAMMDEDTLTVAYRDWRGEPRGKHRKAEGAESLGDCIDCMACVNVCPMGIDIRDGQQLECITCALCIDACDDVMARIGKPRGLIDYIALSDEPREREGQAPRPAWRHVLRPRVMLYTALWALVGLGLLVALFIRADMTISVAPVRNPVFVTLSDGSIRNAYEVRLRNQGGADREFLLSITAEDPLRLSLEGTETLSVTVPADQTLNQRVYLTADRDSEAAEENSTQVRFWIEDVASGTRAYADSVFQGRNDDDD